MHQGGRTSAECCWLPEPDGMSAALSVLLGCIHHHFGRPEQHGCACVPRSVILAGTARDPVPPSAHRDLRAASYRVAEPADVWQLVSCTVGAARAGVLTAAAIRQPVSCGTRP
jgi:hypothetical protein